MGGKGSDRGINLHKVIAMGGKGYNGGGRIAGTGKGKSMSASKSGRGC